MLNGVFNYPFPATLFLNLCGFRYVLSRMAYIQMRSFREEKIIDFILQSCIDLYIQEALNVQIAQRTFIKFAVITVVLS